MIINIRGISGSGKSTLVRAIMSRYPEKVSRVMVGRKQPLGYFLSGVEGAQQLYIPGHYETPCGGCDTMPTANSVALRIFTARDAGMDVLFEGSKFYGGTRGILPLSKAEPGLRVISLSTDPRSCAENLTKRRAKNGKERPINLANLMVQSVREEAEREILAASGVDLQVMVYDDALEAITKLLKL